MTKRELKKEICSKCVYHKKDDGYCYYPHGGMQRRINENGVYECTAFWEREQEEQNPAEWSEEDEAMRDNILLLLSCFVGTSECDSNPSLSTSYPAYQKEMDWLKSLRPQSKEEQKPEVDLEADIEMEWESFNKHVTEDGEDVVWLNWLSFVDIAKYFYELGLKARKEE